MRTCAACNSTATAQCRLSVRATTHEYYKGYGEAKHGQNEANRSGESRSDGGIKAVDTKLEALFDVSNTTSLYLLFFGEVELSIEPACFGSRRMHEHNEQSPATRPIMITAELMRQWT